MQRIAIYTKSWCPYSVRAKALLERRNLEFTDIDVTAAEIVVVGLRDVTLGDEVHAAWMVEVVVRGVRQRLFIRDGPEPTTLAVEVVGQPLRLELVPR